MKPFAPSMCDLPPEPVTQPKSLAHNWECLHSSAPCQNTKEPSRTDGWPIYLSHQGPTARGMTAHG